MEPDKKEFDWFDHPESRKLLWRLLIGACIVSVLLEVTLFFDDGHGRHGHFGDHSVDGWFGFYAVLGFVACALMIYGAKFLGKFLKKDEDYYGDPEDTTLPEDIDESIR